MFSANRADLTLQYDANGVRHCQVGISTGTGLTFNGDWTSMFFVWPPVEETNRLGNIPAHTITADDSPREASAVRLRSSQFIVRLGLAVSLSSDVSQSATVKAHEGMAEVEARRHTGGMASRKKRDDQSATLEILEKRSARATLIILAGIVGEIALVFLFPHNDISWTEKWTLIVCNGFVGLGLAIEYVCILQTLVATSTLQRISDEKVASAEARAAEANQKAAEANARAAEAEKDAAESKLALEKFRAPRILTPEQMDRIAEKLKQFPGTQYDTAVSSNDPEIMTCLLFINLTLAKAGWPALDWAAPVHWVKPIRGPQAWAGVSVSNVVVGMDIEHESSLRPAAQSLADELKAAGIEAFAAPTSPILASAWLAPTKPQSIY